MNQSPRLFRKIKRTDDWIIGVPLVGFVLVILLWTAIAYRLESEKAWLLAGARTSADVLAALAHVRELYWVLGTTLTGFLLLLFGGVTALLRWFSLRNAAFKTIANTDTLTGLPSRRALLACLGDSASSGRSFGELAILCIDLDQFKVVNDRHGHEVGDNVLRRVAARLGKELGDEGFLCRMGGDKFAVVVRGADAMARADDVGRRIVRVFDRPVGIQGSSHVIRVSVGAAVYEDGTVSDNDLLRKADLALYEAKVIGAKARRSTVCFYTPELSARPKRLVESEQALRYAIAERRLTLYYRRIVRSNCNAPVGYEAVVRWNRGDQAVEDILSLVNEIRSAPLANAYAHFVLQAVFVDWCTSRRDVGTAPFLLIPVPASVIVSRDFPVVIRSLLIEHNVDRGRVGIEIVGSDPESWSDIEPDVVAALRAAGVLLIMRGTPSTLTFGNLKSTWWDGLKLPAETMMAVRSEARAAATVRYVIRLVLSFGWRVILEEISGGTDAAWIDEFDQLERIDRGPARPMARCGA